MQTDLNDLRYPIGKYTKPVTLTATALNGYIETIRVFPKLLRMQTESLSDIQLDTPYRPGGWSIRQVVNHCADSHMNCLIRFKLALTESNPVIKPYFEDRWAELKDSKTMPIEPALMILEGVHARWTVLLKSLSQEDLGKTFVHPEHSKEFRLDETIGLYDWHCRHHLRHITKLKETREWK